MRLKHYCNLSGEPTEDARSYCTYSGDKAAASIAPCRRRLPSSSDTCSPSVVAVTVMAWPLAGAPRSRANDKVDLRLVRDADRSVPARHRPRLDRFATAVFTVGGGRGGGWPAVPSAMSAAARGHGAAGYGSFLAVWPASNRDLQLWIGRLTYLRGGR